MEFSTEQKQNAIQSNTIVEGTRRAVWQHPERDKVKINVSSHCAGNGAAAMGLGLIARNCLGTTILFVSIDV